MSTPAITQRADGKWTVDTGRTLLAKRQRLTCETEAEAKGRARNLVDLAKNEGRGAVILSDVLRMEAYACNERLKAIGATLTEATDALISAAGGEALAVPLADVLAAFLREKEGAGCRAVYLRIEKSTLTIFADAHPVNIDTITADAIAGWIFSRDISMRTRRNYFCSLRNLFGFALKKGWIKANPMLSLTKPISDPTVPEIFTPEQAAELMRAAVAKGPEMVVFCALGLFAGIRTAEIEKLDWSAIDLIKRLITISAAIAKKRRTRYPPINDTLFAWIQNLKGEGPIAKPWIADRYEALRKSMSFPWPKNGMRHSFASYHFAAHNNAPLTSALLGHHGDTAVLFAHYRALATTEDASRYWAILP